MPAVRFPLRVVDGPGVNYFGNLGSPVDPLEFQEILKIGTVGVGILLWAPP